MPSISYQPSAAELEILNVIWELQPVSVRDIHARIAKSVGYTTVLKQVQRLTEKGVLEKSVSGSTHLFSCLLDESEVKQNLASRMLQSAFGGSALRMMQHALGSPETTSAEELQALKNWLDQQISKP